MQQPMPPPNMRPRPKKGIVIWIAVQQWIVILLIVVGLCLPLYSGGQNLYISDCYSQGFEAQLGVVALSLTCIGLGLASITSFASVCLYDDPSKRTLVGTISPRMNLVVCSSAVALTLLGAIFVLLSALSTYNDTYNYYYEETWPGCNVLFVAFGVSLTLCILAIMAHSARVFKNPLDVPTLLPTQFVRSTYSAAPYQQAPYAHQQYPQQQYPQQQSQQQYPQQQYPQQQYPQQQYPQQQYTPGYAQPQQQPPAQYQPPHQHPEMVSVAAHPAPVADTNTAPQKF